jgi:hypothetical protein
VSVHHPLAELIVLGVTLTGVYRGESHTQSNPASLTRWDEKVDPRSRMALSYR